MTDPFHSKTSHRDNSRISLHTTVLEVNYVTIHCAVIMHKSTLEVLLPTWGVGGVILVKSSSHLLGLTSTVHRLLCAIITTVNSNGISYVQGVLCSHTTKHALQQTSSACSGTLIPFLVSDSGLPQHLQL